jgi:hypothetical protein
MPVDSERRHCLILGCSSAKNEASEPLPAIQRYDGPPFKVLRRYLEQDLETTQALDIFVLSAKYGLIGGQTAIAKYDQRMTDRRALEMHNHVMEKVQNDLLPNNYAEMFLSMGKIYLQVLAGLEDLVSGNTRLIISVGTAGKKLTDLKSWLWGPDISPVNKKARGFVATRTTPQTAVLRGHSKTLTTAQAIALLQEGIAIDGTLARQVHYWYVDVNGEKISPKWAAQHIFGVPVSQFSADEARRVLRRLGLNCYQQ